MKCFLHLAVVGLLILLIGATQASRIRRQNTFNNLGGGEALLSQLQEDQFRAFNDILVRNQRQTEIIFGTAPSTTTTARPAIIRTTSSPQFLSCLERCPSTNQYNPVCGSDGENYHNEYKLDCARRCGSLVEMVRAGTCQPL